MAGEIQLNGVSFASESSGTITVNNGTIGSSVNLASATFPSGHVLQVLQTVKTDTFSSTVTSTFTAVTGLSQAITLSSASNKVLAMIQLSAVTATNGGVAVASIFRGSTNILIADTPLSSQIAGGIAFDQYTDDSNMPPIPMFMQKLDSPGSVGPHTYQAYVAGQGSSPSADQVFVNRTETDLTQLYVARTTSSITLMEIQA